MKRKKAKKRAAGGMRRLGWRIESALLELFIAVCGRMPMSWMGPAARCVGAIAGVFRPRRKTLETNLKIAFPEMRACDRSRLIGRILENTIVLFFECAKLQRLTPREIVAAGVIDPETEERVGALARAPVGVIWGTAHFGNWEWLAAWMTARWETPFGAVYKPLHNPHADAMLRRRRESKGLPLFSTRESPRALVGYLRKGGKIGMLSDQDAGRRGDFVPFLGKEASTAPGMAQMAERMGLPMAFGFMQRVAPCRFKLRFFFPEAKEENAEGRTRELMVAYHAAIEELVRETPEQYFWWHRRWKTERRGE